MNSTPEPRLPQQTVAPSSSGSWVQVLDDVALAEGHMLPVYPHGVNVLLARVGGAVYAISGICAHMACPLFTGRLDGYTKLCVSLGSKEAA